MTRVWVHGIQYGLFRESGVCGPLLRASGVELEVFCVSVFFMSALLGSVSFF